jgi:hypothetical protein
MHLFYPIYCINAFRYNEQTFSRKTLFSDADRRKLRRGTFTAIERQGPLTQAVHVMQ